MGSFQPASPPTPTPTLGKTHAHLPVSILQSSFQNKTQTLLAGARGAGADVVQYVPPLKAGLEAQAASTAAKLTGVAFDPATADWSKIYTGFPQSQTPTTTLTFVNSVGVAKFPSVGGMKCLSDYAICAFANCTVSFASNPPIAECGCLPVLGGEVRLPGKPNGFPRGSPFNLATSAVILDKKVKVPSVKLCNDTSLCFEDANYNVAPFCRAMQPSATSSGKPTMFDGKFDLISTFSELAWGVTDTLQASNQGFPSPEPTLCTEGGAFAYCETAGCLNKTSWNGLPTTCYCPIYTPAPGTPFFVGGLGSTCSGTSSGSKLQFLQNGGFGPAINQTPLAQLLNG